MAYPRPVGTKTSDFNAARQFEEQVGDWIGDYKIAALKSPDKLDFWIPGAWVEVKEKRQPLSNKWPLPNGTQPQDAFIMDELSFRRAMGFDGKAVYFVIKDVPLNRIFLAPIYEMAVVERVRLNREGKGKFVLDMTNFRQLLIPEDLPQTILADQIATPWKRSDCISQKAIPSL